MKGLTQKQSSTVGIWPNLWLKPGEPGSKAGQPRAGAPDGVKQSAGVSTAPQVTRNKPCDECEATHGPKWQDCVHDVLKKGSADNAYAVCTTSVGQKNAEGGPGSGPHSSSGAYPHKTVGDAIDAYNKRIQIKREPSTIKTESQAAIQQAIKKPGDGSTSGPSVPSKSKGKAPMLAGQKQAKTSGSFHFLGRFKEASASTEGQPGKRFRVVLLEEGLGNFKDAFYYTPEAIQSAVSLYEGTHFFIDHPSSEEEITRPERSVRDLAGYFENCAAEKGGDGRVCLTGDAVLLPDPSLSLFRTQMIESLEYAQRHPDKDLVGLSINASGDFDTITIQEFLNSGEIPDVCREKLAEAVARGVDVIRPVREMTSAVSCDLVTEAGAGGKINQLLERGLDMKKEAEGKEAEAEGKQAEAEGEGMGGQDSPQGDADGQDGSHPDEQQDMELIKSMLAKYLGDGFSDDDHQMMAQHLQAAKEMGLEGKEAEDVAGHSMKMAKHLMSKQAEGYQAEASEPPGAAVGVKGSSTVPAADSKNQMKPSDQEPKEKGVHESSQGKGPQVTTMVAQIARLEQEIAKLRLERSTETAIMESGLPRKVTQKFRESVLPSIRSEAQLKAELKKFKEAYLLGSETERTGFVLSAERTSGAFQEGGSMADFSDCVEK